MKQPWSLFIFFVAACWRDPPPRVVTRTIVKHLPTSEPCVTVAPPPTPCELGVDASCDPRDVEHWKTFDCSGMPREDCERVALALWAQHGQEMAFWAKWHVISAGCLK